MEIKCSKYMSLQLLLEFFFLCVCVCVCVCVCYVMGYVTIKQERFCKRIGERDGDMFMSSKMMKFLNKRERERE